MKKKQVKITRLELSDISNANWHVCGRDKVGVQIYSGKKGLWAAPKVLDMWERKGSERLAHCIVKATTNFYEMQALLRDALYIIKKDENYKESVTVVRITKVLEEIDID